MKDWHARWCGWHVMLFLSPLQRKRGPKHRASIGLRPADLEIKVASIKRITERGRWLRGAAIAKHALVPRIAGKSVGFLAGSGGAFSRGPDGRAEHALA